MDEDRVSHRIAWPTSCSSRETKRMVSEQESRQMEKRTDRIHEMQWKKRRRGFMRSRLDNSCPARETKWRVCAVVVFPLLACLVGWLGFTLLSHLHGLGPSSLPFYLLL